MTENGLVVPNETLWERVSALRDILAPETRAAFYKTFRVAWAYTFLGGWITGKLVWIGVTSALLVGLPFALSVEDESRLIAGEGNCIAAGWCSSCCSWWRAGDRG